MRARGRRHRRDEGSVRPTPQPAMSPLLTGRNEGWGVIFVCLAHFAQHRAAAQVAVAADFSLTLHSRHTRRHVGGPQCAPRRPAAKRQWCGRFLVRIHGAPLSSPPMRARTASSELGPKRATAPPGPRHMHRTFTLDNRPGNGPPTMGSPQTARLAPPEAAHRGGNGAARGAARPAGASGRRSEALAEAKRPRQR